MLADNYLYTINRQDVGLKIALMHKCGTQYHFHERRAPVYDYTMTKTLIQFMESMTDECCDQFLNCCGQADEAKRKEKQRQKEEAAARAAAEREAEGKAPVKSKEELALIKQEKAQRAAEKAARRAEKLKQRGEQSDSMATDGDSTA